jgi:general stress protein YciG
MAKRGSAEQNGSNAGGSGTPKASAPKAGGNMSVREAGRKGGKTTRARYGPEFFQEIGAKGGKAVSERYSNEHFREIGRKGGRRVAELIARAKTMPGDGGEDPGQRE